jgi:hypothetical protein
MLVTGARPYWGGRGIPQRAIKLAVGVGAHAHDLENRNPCLGSWIMSFHSRAIGNSSMSEEPMGRGALDWSAVVVALVTAIVGGLIGFFSRAYIENRKSSAQAEIEREKSRTNIVLQILQTGDKAKALASLVFAREAGLLDDPDGKIKRLIVKSQLVDDLRKDDYVDVANALDSGNFGLATSLIDEKAKQFAKEFERLGDKAAAQKDLSIAESAYKEALDRYEQALGKEDTDTIAVRRKLDELKKLR